MGDSPALAHSWSPDGKLIAAPVGYVAENYMTVVTIPVATGEVRFFTPHHWSDVRQLAWFPDSSHVLVSATETLSSTFRIWQVSYPAGEAQRLTNDLNGYRSISLAADANALVTVQSEQVSNLWVMPASDSAQATQITATEIAVGLLQSVLSVL